MAKTRHDERIFRYTINFTLARLRVDPSNRQKGSYSKPGHNTYFNFKVNSPFSISFQLPVYNL